MVRLGRIAFAALVLGTATPVRASGEAPVRLFVLAGQSNMEGKAKVSLLERQIVDPRFADRFRSLHEDGVFRTRDDVWIQFLDRRGPLTVGFGSPGCVGPELGFGRVVGDRFDEPVVLVKAAWGGKSLYRDFRPPSAGLPSDDVLAAELERRRKREAELTREEVVAAYGHFYREMLEQVAQTRSHLGEWFPECAGRDIELSGFVWFQGWNDMIDETATAEYADNLAHLVRDLRRDLQAPELPVVIGVLGVDGVKPAGSNPGRERFQAQQAAVGDLPEFAEHLRVVQTAPYWDEVADAVFRKGWKEHLDEWNEVGSDYPYHYLGSPHCMLDIGEAFGRAMLESMGEASVSSRSGPPRERD